VDERKWIDDPRTLRAIAHPLRVQMLGALRRFGPATATQLARRFDETTGATSYHLRQLARHGFVEEDPDRGRGRERWWRPTAQMTAWRTTEVEGDPEGREASAWLQRHQLHHLTGQVEGWLARQWEEDKAWRAAAELSDYQLRLSPAGLEALVAELREVLDRHRVPSDAPDARDVVLGLLALPLPPERL
jgi:DNA-binding transcriptional ArsR family regulator